MVMINQQNQITAVLSTTNKFRVIGLFTKISLTGHDKGVPISIYIQIIQTMTSYTLLLGV